MVLLQFRVHHLSAPFDVVITVMQTHKRRYHPPRLAIPWPLTSYTWFSTVQSSTIVSGCAPLVSPLSCTNSQTHSRAAQRSRAELQCGAPERSSRAEQHSGAPEQSTRAEQHSSALVDFHQAHHAWPMNVSWEDKHWMQIFPPMAQCKCFPIGFTLSMRSSYGSTLCGWSCNDFRLNKWACGCLPIQ